MRVLWVTNIPPVGLTAEPRGHTPFGGSWLSGSLNGLLSQRDNDVAIAFPGDFDRIIGRHGPTRRSLSLYGLKPNRPRTLLPGRGFDKRLDQVLASFRPDLVHIHGTEYPHSWATIDRLNSLEILQVTSLQGVISEIARTYLSGIPPRVQMWSSLGDILRGGGLSAQQRKLYEGGLRETEAIRRSMHFIGRTTWDRSVVENFNPAAAYYHCPETLRDSYYRGVWTGADCRSGSILMSQGSYPIKGLHVALEALTWVRQQHPNARLMIAGPNPIGIPGVLNSLKMSTYGRYIRRLIREYGLEDRVEFLGVLEEEEMKVAFLNSNVFLCASSMENESNALSEAKALGMPVVAAFVGGVSSRVDHGVDGYSYHAASPHLLAHFLNDLLSNEEGATRMGRVAQSRQRKMSDMSANGRLLMHIYEEVLDSLVNKC